MNKKNGVIISVIALAIFLLTTFFVVNYLIWRNNYKQLIYPDTRLGNLNLSGLNIAAARNLIEAQAQNIENSGLKFQNNGQTAIIPAAVVSFDADLSYQILSFDSSDTAAMAFGETNERTFIHYLLARFKLSAPRKIKMLYTLDTDKIKILLQTDFPNLDIEPVNAYFSLSGNKNIGFIINNNPEQSGKEINYPLMLGELSADLDDLNNPVINLQTHSKYALVRQNDLNGLKNAVQNIINRGNFSLRLTKIDPETTATSTKYWEIRPDQLIGWFSAQKNNGQTTLSLDQNKIEQYLTTAIAPQVNQDSVQPRFTMQNGKVSSWLAGKNGWQVDLSATVAQISASLLGGQNQTDLIIKTVIAPDLSAGNGLNIKEIIGTGHSNFAGSPANRIHNIKVGMAALQGLLIKPGEEFSTIMSLGDISAKTGYLQELVIKDNQTLPEYGGGLCQIGTTLFRAALASGLPITMRQNHSYRVSYYEPAGTDATIYDPQPDLRFVNDTGNYILIQARMVKNDLYFDFWGTSDGRIATTTAPIIYNDVKPAPEKLIETDALAPGQQKCTEHAHDGVDAYFDYTVTYPADATSTPVHTRRFKSHYVPWQEVCLVGAATSTPATSSASTSAN